MPRLTIDNQSVDVPDGTNVLEAAKKLGIVIPHFCYHEALGAVGACRLCAMKFEDGPVKGIQMSCMVEAKDGMVVSTVDPTAVELRAHVIEWLMTNHPHDCPVCDEGGECQLQDMTVAGGHTLRRYRGRKRTYTNQQLGPFIEHEMNRCIQCYRCVRTYQDYCGGDDFGVMGVNQRVYFGRFRDGRLESPFSGNLVDVCPTGVFTDKTFRFKTRYWDIEEAPSVCPHCSLGCATVPGGRYRELQRTRAGVNRETNGFFICDRGRFGYGHVNHPERPRQPRLGGQAAPYDDVLAAVRQRIEQVVAEHGPGAVAFLGSPRASLEANVQLLAWARELGSERVAFEAHVPRDWVARTLVAGLGTHWRSLEGVRHSDCVVLFGLDPLAEAPMLALALRQAVRRGGQVAVVDPRPVELPCRAAHLPLPPWRLAEAMAALADNDFSAFSRQEAVILEGVRDALQTAERPLLVGGGDLLGVAGLKRLLTLVDDLSRENRPCGLMVPLAGPNSFGGALLAGSGADFEDLVNAAANGELKVLVCLENDPLTGAVHPGRTAMALGRLETLVVLDSLPTRTARQADILLPTTATAEGDGTFINNEGRMLAFARVMAPGIPIEVTGGGDHPPRTFAPNTPGDQPRAAWEVLARLRGKDDCLETVRREIASEDLRFSGLAGLQAGSEGRHVSGGGPMPAVDEENFVPGENKMVLLVTEGPFGSEEMSCYSAPLDPVRPEPCLYLHPADAGRLSIADGETVRLVCELGEVVLPVVLSERMATGVAVLPRLRGTALECLVPGAGVHPCSIVKEARHA